MKPIQKIFWQFNILCSTPFAVDSSSCLAVHLPSSPLRPSSKIFGLWPRENQYWRTKQFVSCLQECKKGLERQPKNRGVPAGVCLANVNGLWGNTCNCFRVRHACTGRRRWQQEEQAWVDLTFIRCVACRSNEYNGGGGQRLQGGTLMGPRRLSFTCAHAHSLQLHTDSWGGHRQTPPSEPGTQALGRWCANRFRPLTAHIRRMHIFVWDCLYNSHCGSLSPTLVAYAGGGSLTRSQRVSCSICGGLRGRWWGWWESIL